MPTSHQSLRERIVARVGAALGLPVGDDQPGRHADLAPLLMPAMMRRFDLDHAALRDNNPDLVGLLQARCRGCAVKGLCMEAVGGGVSAEAAAGFCPNASLFAALRPRKAS